MKIEKWYDDELQSISIDTWWMMTHFMIEKENIQSWENGLSILWDFIENPMDYHIWMDDWWEVYDSDTCDIDITFNLWYQDNQRTIQVSMIWVEIRLYFDKKEILYFAWVLKDCIENVKKSLFSKIW